MKVTFGADPGFGIEAEVQQMKFTPKELEMAATVLKDSSLATSVQKKAALRRMTGMTLLAAGMALYLVEHGRYTTQVFAVGRPKEKEILLGIPPKATAAQRKLIPFMIAHEKGHFALLQRFRSVQKRSREWFIQEVAADYWALNWSKDRSSFDFHIRVLKEDWNRFTDWNEILLAGVEAARQCLPKDAWV